MSAYDRARENCIQDSYENCPFASVGGLKCRTDMKLPEWIAERDRDEYLRGYRDQALQLYGPDWQTCEFSWRPVLEIPGRGSEDDKA